MFRDRAGLRGDLPAHLLDQRRRAEPQFGEDPIRPATSVFQPYRSATPDASITACSFRKGQGPDLVAVVATLFGLGDASRVRKVLDDPVRTAIRDPETVANITESHFWVACNAHQRPTMIGQKHPVLHRRDARKGPLNGRFVR